MGRRTPPWLPLAVVAAALGWVALGLQLFLTTRLAVADGKNLVDGLIVYLSYFTILTNILVALTISIPLALPRSKAAAFFSRAGVNTGVATSIAVVGITYSFLLRQMWDPQGMQLVADVLLHDVMPLLFLLYWWLVIPAGSLRWTDVGGWIVYPALYLAFALFRGALSGEYPYHFIDAGRLGYARVFLNALGILLGFVTVAFLLLGAGRAKGPRTDPAGRPPG